MELSDEGVAFLARWEGVRNRPYNDQLGHCTVGIGHLLHMGGCTDEEFARSYSDEEVHALFREDVARYVAAVNRDVTVPLTQRQFDALVSFAFNWGIGAGTGFGSTSVVTLVNSGDFQAAAVELVEGKGPSGRPYDKGLTGVRNRRVEEAAWLSGGTPMKFVTRSEWGARAPRGRTALNVSVATAHWGGDSPGALNHDECAAWLRSWQAMHMDTHGWTDLAYNLAVCQHGYVFEGRGKGARSAANGTNEGNGSSYAIVYIGGTPAPFTAEAKVAFNQAADYLGASLDWGHRDWLSTACPGDEIYEWVHAGHPADGTTQEDEMNEEQINTLKWCQDVLSRVVANLHPENDAYGGAEEVNRVVREARDHLASAHNGGGGGGVTLEEVRGDLRARLQ